MIAVADRDRAQRCRIRSRAWLGQREARDHFAAGKLRQPFLLLLFVAEHDDALAADADIGADDGAKGGRRVAELERDEDFLLHRQSEPAVFVGDGNAEEAELAHLLDDRVGHTVFIAHLGFDRHAFLAYEAAHRIDQLSPCFRIERHPGLLG